MTKSGRPIRDRSSKMHPLFIDLYLSGGSDDSAKEAERRARRRITLQKRVTRHA